MLKKSLVFTLAIIMAFTMVAPTAFAADNAAPRFTGFDATVSDITVSSAKIHFPEAEDDQKAGS